MLSASCAVILLWLVLGKVTWFLESCLLADISVTCCHSCFLLNTMNPSEGGEAARGGELERGGELTLPPLPPRAEGVECEPVVGDESGGNWVGREDGAAAYLI